MTQRPTAAVFVVRSWWEDGQFRARISYSTDAHSGPKGETQILTAHPDEVREHLTLWLDESSRAASR